MRRRQASRRSRIARAALSASIIAAPAAATALAEAATTPTTPTTPPSTPSGSQPSHRSGALAPATIRVKARSYRALGGQPTHVRGTLLPAGGARTVRLQELGRDGWHNVASTRTGSRGAFDLRFTATGSGRQRLRVVFAGDAEDGGAESPAGTVEVFLQSVASWYDDGGSTACGFHSYYGVANRTLPCGTKVSFDYHGRTVDAVVDDRGPFEAGRDWDLNQNTASALGFGGVDTVWSSE